MRCVVKIFILSLHLLTPAPRAPTTKKPAAPSTTSATSTTPSEKKVGGVFLFFVFVVYVGLLRACRKVLLSYFGESVVAYVIPHSHKEM